MRALILALTLFTAHGVFADSLGFSASPTRMTAQEIQSAEEDAAAQFQTLNQSFQLSVRERIENSSSTSFATAEVETLPNSEIVEPWILSTAQAPIDRVESENVRALETAQLSPGDRASDGGARIRAQ